MKAMWPLAAKIAPGSRSTVYVEDKFDGIRAQLHRNAERVEIFSRDLKRITDQFPELAEQARKFDVDLILDGEIVAFEQGRKLTFFDLQKRLGRKSDGADLFAGASADVPVAFIAFDLLWLNGRSLLKAPLRERRELLRDLQLPPQFQIAEVFPAHSAAEIEQIFQASEKAFERRPDDQRSGKFLFARPARNVLVQTKEGAGHARRRGGGGGARPRQTQQGA